MPSFMQKCHFPIALAIALGFAMIAPNGLALTAPLAHVSATPESQNGGIAPIIWELTEFVDTVSGPTEIDNPQNYTVQFLPEGVLAVGADCNRAVMSYETSGPSLQITPGVMTLARCSPESLSDKFVEELGFVSSYTFDQGGASDRLSLALKADGGFLHFRPTLRGVVWQWQSFQGGDDSQLAPDDPADYTLQFYKDGTVTGQIDCNRAKGTYSTDGSSISIIMATTKMACPEGSLDADFSRYVSESSSFVIRDGMLALALPMDAGIASFAPVVAKPAESATPESSS